MAYPVIPTEDDKAHFVKVANYGVTPTNGRKPDGHATEGGWFAKWRHRVTMERMVIRKAARDLIAAGYWLRVYYGDGEWGCERTQDLAVVMEAIMACDEEGLQVFPDGEKGKRVGYLDLTYGNDGWDVISDYTTNLEEHLKGANELADKLGDN